MPYRKSLFVNNYYYHVFNHSLGKTSIFGNLGSPTRAMSLMNYYRFIKIPTSYSLFLRFPRKYQLDLLKKLKKEKKQKVQIISFCLMPNHYHLILKQLEKDGIKNFAANFQNSYAKYFNIKNEKIGPVFRGRFKAVLISDDMQLLHLSRYIHLNPYFSGFVKKIEKLVSYSWSSLGQYLGLDEGFCHSKIILDQFKNPADYKKFVFNQADYQRGLEKIKHLTID